MQKKPNIILEFHGASYETAFHGITYAIDAISPKMLKKIPLFKNVPLYNLKNPKPSYNFDLKGTNLADGYEIPLELFGFLHRNWDINRKNLKIFKDLPYRFRTAHGVLTKNDKKLNKYLDFRLDIKDKNLFDKALKNQLEVTKYICEENPVIVFHSSCVQNPNKHKMEKSFNLIKANLRRNLNLINDYQVRIGIENLFNINKNYTYFTHDYRDFQRLFNSIDSKYIGVTFDWGHANIQAKKLYYENKLTKEDLLGWKHQEEFLDQLKGKILHTHLHYNNNHIKDTFYKNQDKHSLRDDLFIDQHSPINKTDSKTLPIFKKLIKKMISENPINHLCLEMEPKRIFGFVPYYPYGGNKYDFIESIKMLREIIEE